MKRFLFFVIFNIAWIYASFKIDEYSKSNCIKSGGSYEISIWIKQCKHK